MDPLQWSPSIAVGHAEIDGQHRELFERAGRFFATMGLPDSKRNGRFSTAFLYLDSYVRFHFTQEERLMARLGYPELARHREEHRTYISRLDAVKSQFESEGESAAVAAAMEGLLRLWLLEHIGRADRLVGEFAASTGGA